MMQSLILAIYPLLQGRFSLTFAHDIHRDVVLHRLKRASQTL